MLSNFNDLKDIMDWRLIRPNGESFVISITNAEITWRYLGEISCTIDFYCLSDTGLRYSVGNLYSLNLPSEDEFIWIPLSPVPITTKPNFWSWEQQKLFPDDGYLNSHLQPQSISLDGYAESLLFKKSHPDGSINQFDKPKKKRCRYCYGH